MHGFCGEVERPTFGYTVALSGTTVLGGLVYLADEKGIICSHDLSGLASVRARIPARSCVQQIGCVLELLHMKENTVISSRLVNHPYPQHTA